MFVKCILLTSDLGSKTDNFNLQHFIKDYLEAKAKSVKQFQNNLLRRDWMNSFSKRRKELTVRLATNIKKVRTSFNETSRKGML